ncbi:MAG: copper transporter [Actinomycetes bacterium]
MINFRFHVVSIVAVFLSLALGIMIGSTVVDRAIVSSLRNQIERVEANSDAQRAENSALSKELALKGDYVNATSSFAVSGRLPTVALAIIAEPGATEENLAAFIELSRNAGSVVGGFLRLTEKWSDDSQVSQLRTASGVQERGAKQVRASAWSAITRRVAAGVGSDSQDDLLVRLSAAGFVEYKSVADGAGVPSFPAGWPGVAARAVYVAAPTKGDLATQAALISERVSALARQGLFTVAAENHVDGDGVPARGLVLSNVADDGSTRDHISSVDNFELIEGRVSAVLASADLSRGVNGRYGYGEGATAASPEWWAL